MMSSPEEHIKHYSRKLTPTALPESLYFGVVVEEEEVAPIELPSYDDGLTFPERTAIIIITLFEQITNSRTHVADNIDYTTRLTIRPVLIPQRKASASCMRHGMNKLALKEIRYDQHTSHLVPPPTRH